MKNIGKGIVVLALTGILLAGMASAVSAAGTGDEVVEPDTNMVRAEVVPTGDIIYAPRTAVLTSPALDFAIIPWGE